MRTANLRPHEAAEALGGLRRCFETFRPPEEVLELLSVLAAQLAPLADASQLGDRALCVALAGLNGASARLPQVCA